MELVARLTRNRDDTWTVRVGRQVEHINILGKTRSELFSAIKYALMSKGIVLSDVEIVELMKDEK